MSPETEEEMLDGPGESSASQRRANSTIKFPYVGLDDVSAIADTMLNRYGGHCSMVQLASALEQKPSSGAFRVKVTAAKMFGVVSGRGDNLSLTPMGSALTDPDRRRQARVDAFLQVPLYKAIYDEATRQGGMMPGSLKGIEQMIVRLGVVPNQAETARLAFNRSARFAGFFEHGDNRLIMPALGPETVAAEEDADASGSTSGGSSDDGPDGDDLPGKPTLLVEVFKRLPDEGEAFSQAERELWSSMLEAILNVLYPDSTRPPKPAEAPTWTE